MTIGDNIRRFRKREGLTQQQLGDKLGVSQSAIGQFEKGTSLKIETIQKIAIALEVPVGRLIPFNRKCLPSESQKQKIQSIADYYGFRKQSMMMIEECSELQKAICKWHRNRGDSLRSESSDCTERRDIIDELADVIIMAKQITYLLSAEDEVSEQIEFKLDRQLRRMEEESSKE